MSHTKSCNSSSGHTAVPLELWNSSELNSEQSRAKQSRAVVYCWQPASTVTPGIEPCWDPWPYICSVSRLLYFFLLSLFLVRSSARILLYPLGTDHAQKTQLHYCCMVQTTQKTCVMCQAESSLVHYQHWVWRGWHRKHKPHLFLHVGLCLQSCCLTTCWSNPLQYIKT
jgi:hypothetical protein